MLEDIQFRPLSPDKVWYGFLHISGILKNIELQNKSYNDKVDSNTPDNLIYQGPMSGMEEALNKFKETGEKTGDIR